MNKVAIFAHYDKNNLIHDYVIYYLQSLKKIANKIIFVSDCDINNKELSKLKNITEHILAKKHGEYDFGSYKKGYFLAKEKGFLSDCSELIFANDSCFGPIVPLENIFLEMSQKNCDFWGMNENSFEVEKHAQSFFMAFKSNVFQNEIFDNFMNNIKKEENKDDIIQKYEIGLSKILLTEGFSMETYIKKPIERNINGDFLNQEQINPLIKTCAIKGVCRHTLKLVLNYQFKKYKINYPLELILNYAKLDKTKKNILKNINTITKIFIRIQTKRKRVYFFGKWYDWGKR